MSRKPTRSKVGRILPGMCGAVALGYLLLLIPEPQPPVPRGAGKQPFAWDRDAFWTSLQRQFESARSRSCEPLMAEIAAAISRTGHALDSIVAERVEPTDLRLDLLETNLFLLTPLIAACPQQFTNYLQLAVRLRDTVKRQSELWDINPGETRDRVYRLLYGGRAALEEVMLQLPRDAVPAVVTGRSVPSRAPASRVLGVTVHSGDILVSRGGAPTSALIARGNDYPGNFSHVALVHVDETTSNISIVEAHIEQGVVISSFADYLRDKKLRVMVLRLRPDLAPLKADPLLPHKAATAALREAKARHIPYDFEMNHREHGKRFCSEVASAAYEPFGVRLWTGVSHISSPGILRWLGAFGVKHFETQEPSDLEYDPQLAVVAEWRDPDALFQDHLDNAVVDVMLEGADAGDRLNYSVWMLPPARVLKAWSALLNLFGAVGPIPEGMSATGALRNRAFSRRHAAIRARLLKSAEEFRKQRGYTPPYWELVKLARPAKSERDASR